MEGDDSGVGFLPSQTSSILERTLLIKAARVITFSDAERLATVDRGCGLLTMDGKSMQKVKFKTMLKQRSSQANMHMKSILQHIKMIGTFSKYGSRVLVWFCSLNG